MISAFVRRMLWDSPVCRVPFWGVMSNELSTPKMLVCPSDEHSAQTNFLMQIRDAIHLSRLKHHHRYLFLVDAGPARRGHRRNDLNERVSLIVVS